LIAAAGGNQLRVGGGFNVDFGLSRHAASYGLFGCHKVHLTRCFVDFKIKLKHLASKDFAQ